MFEQIIIILIAYSLPAIFIGLWARSWNHDMGRWIFASLIITPMLAAVVLLLMGRQKQPHRF